MAQTTKSNKPIKIQETLEYQQRRTQIQAEINSNPMIIDKECFKKSTIEKLKLKELKKAYKSNTKDFKDYLIKQVLYNPLICGTIKLTVK